MRDNRQLRRTRSDSDRQCFTALYHDHALALLGYGLRRTSNEDAVDMVSETFAVAWRRLQDVPAGDGARPWLFGVARHVLLNQGRSNRRRNALTQRLVAAVEQVAPDETAASDDSLLMDAALKRLDPLDQELLMLTCWEGLSPTEVAEALDMAAGTVRSRLHRARKNLRRLLESTHAAPTTTPGERCND